MNLKKQGRTEYISRQIMKDVLGKFRINTFLHMAIPLNSEIFISTFYLNSDNWQLWILPSNNIILRILSVKSKKLVKGEKANV